MKSILALLLLCATVSAATITVDPSTSFQTIVGWEATCYAGRSAFPSQYAIYKNDLADQAVEMGVNRVRVEVKIQNENTAANASSSVNDNADPFVINNAGFQWANDDAVDDMIDFATLLRSRLIVQGESLYVVLCYVCFRSGAGYFQQSSDPEEYAELVEATFIHINASYGWVPNAVEIILEPDNAPNPAAGWTAGVVASSLTATRSRLAGHGWNPDFIIPSTTSCPNAVTWYGDIKTALGGSMPSYVSELSYHRYVTCDTAQLQANRNAAQADGKRVSMLECWANAGCTNDYTVLHQDIGPNGNAVAWEPATFGAPGGPGGLFTIDGSNNVTLRDASKYYRQYWKWVRRGAVRKATSTDNANFDGLAFQNPNGAYTVVVKCATSGSFSIAGLPAGRYHLVYTTDSDYNHALADQVIAGGGSISTSIPAAGVMTVFLSSSASVISGTVKLSGGVVIQ